MMHRTSLRVLILLACALLVLPGQRCRRPEPAPPRAPLAAAPGTPDYQRPAEVPIPGGLLHVAGGALRVHRTELDLDTRLGRYEISAIYDSAAAGWRWSFELEHRDGVFTDASGAVYATQGLAAGTPIPGSRWQVEEAGAIATRSGLVHGFGAGGELRYLHWRGAAYPRLVLHHEEIDGALQAIEIRQHTSAEVSTPVYALLRDSSGRLVAIEDRAGRRAEFLWIADQLVQARDALDVDRGWPGFRYEYSAGRLSAITNSEGERVEYAYQAGRLGVVRAVGDPDSVWAVHLLPKAPDGRYTTQLTDPLGGLWRFRYDGARRLHAIEDPRGGRVSITWTGLRPASRTDAAGVTTRWVWQDDDLIEELQPSGNRVRMSWAAGAIHPGESARRALARIEDDLGLIEEREYDVHGRLVASRNGAGEQVAFTWGALGEILSQTASNGRTARFSGHGEHGHPTRVTDGSISRTREYDAVGNLLDGESIFGELGPARPGVVSRRFDADRNLAVVVLAGSFGGAVGAESELVIEHRSDGRRRRVLRPGGGDTEFLYDSRGLLVERRDRAGGDWQVNRIERDVLGRPVREDRPNGTWTTRAWGLAGELEEIAHGRGGVAESSLAITWTAGRPTAMLDPEVGAAEELHYDAAGRVETIRHPGGEWLQLGWDLRSRNTDEVYWLAAGGLLRHLSYGYDAAGRLETAYDGGALLVRRRYEAGRWVEIETGNGLVRTASYDASDGLLASTRTLDAAGQLVEDTAFSRESPSGIVPATLWVAETILDGGLAGTTYESHVVAPDFGTTGVGPRAAGFGQDFYSHDPLGNTIATQFRGYVYGPQARQLERIEDHAGEPIHEYAWDAAGYATERDGVAIEWDAAGRIQRIEGVAEFSWDAIGRMRTSEAAGQVARYRFGGRVVGDAQGSPVAIERREVRIDLVAGDHRWRHFDFRGNAKFTTDTQGEVVSHRRFDPYGTREILGTDPDAIGFAQGLELGELVVLGGRLYDSAAGRFLAPDPVFQVVNAYAYAQSNPLWFWDPSGRNAQTAVAVAAGFGIAGMAVGAVVAGVVATPVAFGIGLGLTVFSAGVTAGVLTPFSATAQTAVGGIATAAYGLGGYLAGAFPGGFAVGQGLRSALESDFGAGVGPGGPGAGGSSSPRGDGGAENPPNFQFKVVEISFEAPGSLSTPGGCAPLRVGGVAPDLSRWLLLLIPLQAFLAWRAAAR